VDRSQVAVIIPTLRAASHWQDLTAALALQGIPAKQILIVDSGSADGTPQMAVQAGFQLLEIPREEFRHGGTRQLAARHVPWAKIVIYLTQDSFPVEGAFDTLLRAFDDPQVAAAYGRQLPRPGAGPIEAHARFFNYPATSRVHSFADRQQLGIKAAFFSNNFAAYRTAALEQAGGFSPDTIMAEDTLMAARLLMLGWKTAYVAEAQSVHSHSYSMVQSLHRYFDIGVYHVRESWLRESFGEPGDEGNRFVVSEMRALWPRHIYLLPYALLLNAAKLLGYRLGRLEARLGRRWAKRLSYHPSFWDRRDF